MLPTPPGAIDKPLITAEHMLPGGEVSKINAAMQELEKTHPILAGALKGTEGTLEGLTSPASIATLAVLPESRAIQAFFAAQAAHGAYQDTDSAIAAYRQGNNEQAAQYFTSAGLNAVATLLAAGHAALGGHGENVSRETTPAKPVLHGTNDLETLREHAPAAAEKLGDAAAEAAKAVPGAEVEAVRDAKDADRIEDKAARQGVQPSQIGDIAAAKVTVPDQQAADQVLEGVNRQLPVESKEGAVAGEPGKNDVRQTQALVRTGGPGEPVQHAELLVQTPEMAKATDETHDDYRKAQELRAQGDEEGAKRLEAQVAERHNQAEQEAQARLAEKPEERTTRYKYGNTQANIPDSTPAAQALSEARAKIPEADSAGDGKDVGAGGNHVTVRYGIDGDDTKGIEDYIRSQGPFTAHLGETEVFPPSPNSKGAAIVVARVESPELNRINQEIEREGKFAPSDFPEYKPHATIAYIDPAKAEQYAGRADLKGKEFPIDHISIADRNGGQRDVPLEGSQNAIRERGAGGVLPREQGQTGEPGSERGGVGRGLEGQEAPRVQQGLESEGGTRVPGGASGERSAPRPPEKVAARDQIQPGDAGRMKLSDLKLAPKRFQYKLNTNDTGTTNLLSGRRWNEDLAGRIEAWRDPADGQVYVVNGHHRFGLAKETGQPSIGVEMMRAKTAEEARSIGALRNIAGGRGTALDAAKFFRDSKFSPEDLDKLGVSMGEATAANGMALARLDPRVFDDVVSGKLRQGRAIAIGKASADAADQEAILKLIDRAEKKGKRVPDDVVEELGRMVAGAEKHTETQQNLFGLQEMTRNLALEKADISQAVRDRIGEERRTFAAVSKEARAAKLSAVEGQTVKAGENAKIAEKAQQDLELYDRLSTRGGTIDEILNRAAKDLAEGGNANQIKQRAYDDIRAELGRTLPRAEAGRDRGIPPARAEEQAQARPERAPRPPGGAATREPIPRVAGSEPEQSSVGFKPGRQSTPVLTLGRDGKWTSGTLQHWNPGYNGAKAAADIRTSAGERFSGVSPDSVVRLVEPGYEPKPLFDTEKEREVIRRTKRTCRRWSLIT